MCILQNMQNLPKEPMRADINVPDPQNRRTSQKLMPSLGIRAKGVPPQDKLKLPQPNQLLQGDCKRLCCFGVSGPQGASICLRAPSWRPRLTYHAGRPVRSHPPIQETSVQHRTAARKKKKPAPAQFAESLPGLLGWAPGPRPLAGKPSSSCRKPARRPSAVTRDLPRASLKARPRRKNKLPTQDSLFRKSFQGS